MVSSEYVLTDSNSNQVLYIDSATVTHCAKPCSLSVNNQHPGMLKIFKNLFSKNNKANKLLKKNRVRFDRIISNKHSNFLESIYKRLFDKDPSLTDTEILEAYFTFSNNIQTNTFAAVELEWVTISVLCHFRPNLTETLIRRALLSTVYSLGDDIDWFTVEQFIDRRILADNTEPYGGLPPNVGQEWLKDLLPAQKETVQKVLEDVIDKNRKELENI